MASQTTLLSGTDILRAVRDDLAPYRAAIQFRRRQVTIIRFEADASDPPQWRWRMQACRISAEQKVKAFDHLGFAVEHLALPGHIAEAEFAALLAARNRDSATAAVIVQLPVPGRLSALVGLLDPAKDLDGLLKGRSPQVGCATAEGICRLVVPFADAGAVVAVVGARGFVGGDVVRLLKQQGRLVIELDAGDDLGRVADADMVISAVGSPHVLTRDHLRTHHRLVVDAGFSPRGGGVVFGDVHPNARAIPQYLTPVPGGVGPVEMAVLMERIVRQEADPGVAAWRLPALRYRHRGQAASPPGHPPPPPERGRGGGGRAR
ncbi:MAG: bifunctional 5,10-methylenetetrahydrofolate dehydrogenase/5,10-methenyltetrahydrofolate cyclohydrolase [Pseudonocardiales bacterium]|nr:bifunctional 5,10-methylenetetrahydrofolate dehydrogenase/5,10-methenyltetrahydrofolate cyclohydrolase [Pseudonocardiales bacterium]